MGLLENIAERFKGPAKQHEELTEARFHLHNTAVKAAGIDPQHAGSNQHVAASLDGLIAERPAADWNKASTLQSVETAIQNNPKHFQELVASRLDPVSRALVEEAKNKTGVAISSSAQLAKRAAQASGRDLRVSRNEAELTAGKALGHRYTTSSLQPTDTQRGVYKDEVLAVTEHHVALRHGPSGMTTHEKANLSAVPKVGEVALIKYSQGHGAVIQPAQQKVQQVSQTKQQSAAIGMSL